MSMILSARSVKSVRVLVAEVDARIVRTFGGRRSSGACMLIVVARSPRSC